MIRSAFPLAIGFVSCTPQGADNVADATPKGPGAAVQAPADPEEAYVTSVTGQRRQPSDEKQVDDAQRAASGEALPSENRNAIVKKINPALVDQRTRAKGDELVRLGVEANVRKSANDLLTHSAILNAHVQSGELAVMKAITLRRSLTQTLAAR